MLSLPITILYFLLLLCETYCTLQCLLWSGQKAMEVAACIETGVIFEDKNFSCLRYRTYDTVWVPVVADCVWERWLVSGSAAVGFYTYESMLTCDPWVFTVKCIYTVVLWGMTLCNMVDIRGTHYQHVLWKYLQYVPPKVYIVHLWQECHNSKFVIFLSYWYRKKRLQIYF